MASACAAILGEIGPDAGRATWARGSLTASQVRPHAPPRCGRPGARTLWNLNAGRRFELSANCNNAPRCGPRVVELGASSIRMGGARQ